MSPTSKVLSGSVSSIRVFQNRMLSGRPSRPRVPGSRSRKKSASSGPNDRRPLGTMATCLGPCRGPCCQCSKSSTSSDAVAYRSDARLDKALRQIRSSSAGTESSRARGAGRIDRDHLMEHFHHRAAPEWSLAGQQLVEDDAQREDVAPAVEPMTLSTNLFGTHVGRRAGDVPVPESEASSLIASPKSAT